MKRRRLMVIASKSDYSSSTTTSSSSDESDDQNGYPHKGHLERHVVKKHPPATSFKPTKPHTNRLAVHANAKSRKSGEKKTLYASPSAASSSPTTTMQHKKSATVAHSIPDSEKWAKRFLEKNQLISSLKQQLQSLQQSTKKEKEKESKAKAKT